MSYGMRRKTTRNRRPDSRPNSFTIDLHGMRKDEACLELDRRINELFLHGPHSGIVICGHGTGILLRVIGQDLARHPLVLEHGREGFTAAYKVRLLSPERTDLP